MYYVKSEEEDQELSEGETNEKQEDNEEDEEEADKEMNFDDKNGLLKVVKGLSFLSNHNMVQYMMKLHRMKLKS